MGLHTTSDVRVWRAYPVRAFMIRAVVFIVPVLASIFLGLLVSRLLPAPASTLEVVLWWVVVLGISGAGVYLADRFVRRLLPLATLLRLTMLFPDEAPSRLKVARRVAGSRAIAVELERAHEAGITGNRQEAAETILALVGALGDYDSRTRGHSERTQLFVTMLADELHLKAEDRGRLMWAALVHDIGKLKVPHEVLNKAGKPTEEEWHVLHSHPMQGAQICEPLREWLGEWWLAIEQHHERFDGAGYPRGLAGHQISYGARIVAVADSYEVMTSPRAYKRPMTASAAREELIRCAGTQFDPDVVRAFLNLSIGNLNRWAGPLAWLAQLAMVRPGPVLGQAFGAAAGATAASVSVVSLSLAPIAVGSDDPSGRDRQSSIGTPPVATAPTNPTSTSNTPGQPTPTGTATTTPGTTSGTGPPPTSPTTPTSTLPTSGGILMVDDTINAIEDVTKSVDLLANDVVEKGKRLKLVSVGGAAHGIVAMASDGMIRYTPAANFHGTDAFTYTAETSDNTRGTAQVTVRVASINDVPDPASDLVSVLEDSVSTPLNLITNDTDADGDSMSVTAVTTASHGAVTSLLGGGYAYTPDPNFHGDDTLHYTVSDGHGARASATATIRVGAVNDAPNTAPAAYSTSTAVRLVVDAAHGVLAHATDIDGDNLKVVSDTSPTVTIRADGSLSFLPVLPTTMTIRYVISDGTTTSTGTVTISVSLFGRASTERSPALCATCRWVGLAPVR